MLDLMRALLSTGRSGPSMSMMMRSLLFGNIERNCSLCNGPLFVTPPPISPFAEHLKLSFSFLMDYRFELASTAQDYSAVFDANSSLCSSSAVKSFLLMLVIGGCFPLTPLSLFSLICAR
jgi:hypothetical protein